MLIAVAEAASSTKRRGEYNMHWTAVLLAAYAAGFLELWQACENAPLAPEDD